MNCLHVIELLSMMEKKVVGAKLVTYTKHYQEKGV